MGLEVPERVQVVAPALALRSDFVLRGCAALDAADEPLEHLQRGRAAQAVRPRHRGVSGLTAHPWSTIPASSAARPQPSQRTGALRRSMLP